ncbi:sensor histidine kinase [Spirillospora sp. CA-255316]
MSDLASPGPLSPARLRSVARAHPMGVDVLLALALYGATLLVPVLDVEGRTGDLDVKVAVFGAVVCAALVFRRLRPVPVLVVVTAGSAAYLASGGMKSPLAVATMIALYTCALAGSRRRAVVAAIAVAAVLAVAGAVLAGHGWLGPESIALVAQSAFAAALGDAIRNRRAYVTEVEERALRAERTREEEARRRVIDERLRIARELHDVLAHHISLINVQAGVAAHVLETEPAQARESLAHIRRAARSSLEEVRTTIGLLRQPDMPVQQDIEPSPGLHRLPDLIAGLTAAGLIVDQEIAGTPVELPATVDLTAYRVVQEALTNASRYATRPYAVLRLEYLPSGLRIHVSNPAPSHGPGAHGSEHGTGHGLMGMRERAHAIGGSLAVGYADGRFEVCATLPHEGAGT